MVLHFVLASVLLGAALSSAYIPCRQRHIVDFRADDHDCSVFHVCSYGRLSTFTCQSGSVFDESTRSCVPANSFLDRCSSRMAAMQRCPLGFRGSVPHPTKCAQYYECGDGRSVNRQGWEKGLRECPYPTVFSTADKKCVDLSPGVCGTRQEPLDQCDYKENQCERHAECIPCQVRFPSCRGRQDGPNAWAGRQWSPYYINCHQQRVVSTGMCEQDGAVVIFDTSKRTCVKNEDTGKPQVFNVVNPVQQMVPQRPHQQQSYLPHGYVSQSHVSQGYLPHGLTPQNDNSHQQIINRPQGAYHNGFIPQRPVQTPSPNHSQQGLNQIRFPQNLNQFRLWQQNNA